MSHPLARAAGIAVALASAVTWWLLNDLEWPARAFATFLLVPLPVLLLLQTRLVGRLPLDEEREAVYVSSAASVWGLAILAMVAARLSDVTRDDLWLSWPGMLPMLLATGGVVAAGVALMAAAGALGVPESPVTRFLLPRTFPERIAFAGLSVSAGIAEELVFRSFLLAALLLAGAGLPAAVVISIAVFAVSHAYQGALGVLRVALLGALLTAPLLVVDSVYPAMAAHAILDLLAGLVLADWLDVDGEH